MLSYENSDTAGPRSSGTRSLIVLLNLGEVRLFLAKGLTQSHSGEVWRHPWLYPDGVAVFMSAAD